jgi:bifunctional non-homologous end joining protein LigD
MSSSSLQQYHQKRNFLRTAEPKGRTGRHKKSDRKPIFVIQKNQDRRLHWDFRLEWDGVLKSWAVPMEPSLDPKVRRLAVQVEDHPFEPKGEYGAGHVEIWDSGFYVPPKDFGSALDRGHLTVTLRGRRLKGSYTLQRLPDDPTQWLLFKNAKPAAQELHLSLEGRDVHLTHLDKVWYPEAAITKRNVLNYYRKISDVLLPHLSDRPITLKRYPEGVTGDFFYEKRCPSHRPAWLETVKLKEISFCRIDSLAALFWAVNLGSLELHPYLMSGGETTQPRSMVFDLDPGPGTGILECARVALEVRGYLKKRGLRAFPKTSGSKGIQVYVPLNPARGSKVNFEATKAFSRKLAEQLEREHPKLVVSRMAKNLRAGKIFIDWSQNDRAKTTVAVYSLRATPQPRVSTPLRWSELEAALRAREPSRLEFSPSDVLKRVRRHGDLFKPVLTLRQDLHLKE